MNQQQIIIETILYYQTHPRSVRDVKGFDEPQCRYWGRDTDNNKIHCAVARCVSGHLRPRLQGTRESYSAEEVIHELGDKMFYMRYQGHSEVFWTDLQSLHDFPAYWEEEGPLSPKRSLSVAGAAHVRRVFDNDDPEIILDAI